MDPRRLYLAVFTVALIASVPVSYGLIEAGSSVGGLAAVLASIVAAVILGAATLAYAFRVLIPLSSLGAARLGLLLVAFFFVAGLIRIEVAGLASTVAANSLLTYSSWVLVAFVVSAARPAPITSLLAAPGQGFSLEALKALARLAVRVSVLASVVVAAGLVVALFLAAAYSYLEEAPVLALDKVVLPDEPTKVLDAREAVEKILVSARSLEALVILRGEDRGYAVSGEFEGSPERPVGGLVKTSYGSLAVDNVIASRFTVVESDESLESAAKAAANRGYILVGLEGGGVAASVLAKVASAVLSNVPAGVLDVLANQYFLEIIGGLILFVIGTLIVRGGSSGKD